MIDFHTHIFPDKIVDSAMAHLTEIFRQSYHKEPYLNGKLESLFRSNEEAGLSCSVILPVVTAPKQFDSIHRFAMQFLEEETQKRTHMISFGGIHPDMDDYKERLRWIKEQGFQGIKLHPDYQNCYFNDMRYKRIISYASELDLMVVTHAGQDPVSPEDIHCTPQMALEVIKEVQPTRLILAHMGGNAQHDDVERYLVGQNVYFDTSYVLDIMDPEQLVRTVRNHGADKVLFATDSPWADQKKFVEIFKNLPFTEEERSMIAGDNARRILNMSK